MTDRAVMPTKTTKYAAGLDLYSANEYDIMPQDRKLILTDLGIKLPDKCYGRIAPRSGLALNHFIHVGAGVIDPDFCGNIGVVLFNFGKNVFKVKSKDKIAQLILERIYQPDIEECFQLNTTERGVLDFGSSGNHAKNI